MKKRQNAFVLDVRAKLEAAVARLAARRKEIDEELRVLVAMLAAGERPRPKPKDERGRDDVTAAAMSLLDKHPGGVTPADLAERTGQSAKNAAQTLARLWRTKRARRLRKGVYGRIK